MHFGKAAKIRQERAGVLTVAFTATRKDFSANESLSHKHDESEHEASNQGSYRTQDCALYFVLVCHKEASDATRDGDERSERAGSVIA